MTEQRTLGNRDSHSRLAKETAWYARPLTCWHSPLVGLEIEELMAHFGRMSRRLADDPSLRWLGPHKGVVHLALASITNACFDLWAKEPRRTVVETSARPYAGSRQSRPLDLSYVEDVVSREDALAMLRENLATRASANQSSAAGYPGYDTSVGWMAYDDAKVRELTGARM